MCERVLGDLYKLIQPPGLYPENPVITRLFPVFLAEPVVFFRPELFYELLGLQALQM